MLFVKGRRKTTAPTFRTQYLHIKDAFSGLAKQFLCFKIIY